MVTSNADDHGLIMSEKVVIDKVDPLLSTDRTTPILLHFQNGKVSESDQETMQFFPVKNQEDKTNSSVVLANGNVYHGINKDGEHGSDLMNSYIAIRNKRTNKVRLIPIKEVSLTNYIYLKNEKLLDGRINQSISKYSMLKNYGGRKAIRYLERATRMKVDLDVVKDQLEKTANEADFNATIDSTLTTESNLENIRPPFDVNATKLENVYNINDVIPKETLDSLNDEVITILSADLKNVPISSEYILNRIKMMQNSPSKHSPNNLTLVKAFIYMDALIALIKTRVKNLDKAKLSNITKRIDYDICKRFSAPDFTNNIRTSFSSEKALCYYIVLALITNENYEIDLNVLVQDLSIRRSKIVKYAHYVNAKVKPKTDMLSLRLPSSIKPIRVLHPRRR